MSSQPRDAGSNAWWSLLAEIVEAVWWCAPPSPVPVVQGYGLTETCAASFLALPRSTQSGTVGAPTAGLELRFEGSSELGCALLLPALCCPALSIQVVSLLSSSSCCKLRGSLQLTCAVLSKALSKALLHKLQLPWGPPGKCQQCISACDWLRHAQVRPTRAAAKRRDLPSRASRVQRLLSGREEDARGLRCAAELLLTSHNAHCCSRGLYSCLLKLALPDVGQ